MLKEIFKKLEYVNRCTEKDFQVLHLAVTSGRSLACPANHSDIYLLNYSCVCHEIFQEATEHQKQSNFMN